MLNYQDLQEVITRPQNFGAADKLRVQMAFEKIYASLGFNKPQVICLEDPYQLQAGIKRTKQKSIPKLFSSSGFKKLNDLIWSGLSLKSINGQVWDLVSNQIARSLFLAFGEDDSVLAHMSSINPVFQEIDAAVEREIKSRFRIHKFDFEPLAHHPNWQDLKWLSFYRKVHAEIPLADSLYTMLEAGLMQAFCFDGLVLWCPRAISINCESNNLHNEDGPALIWSEEFKLYYWYGIPVPPKLIEAPESITKEDIAQVKNAELRRSFLEKLGTERFAKLFDLVLVDSDNDLRGNRQCLYRSRDIDPVAKEHLQFAQVMCPTTHRQYFLTVPPNIKNVWEAVSWTFAKTPEEYHPEREV